MDEDARIALERADAALDTAHEIRNELNVHRIEDDRHHHEVIRRVDRLGWVTDSHADRVRIIEREHGNMKTAAERLMASVERLEAKLPPSKHAGEHVKDVWREATPKAKVGLIAGLIALFSAPEIVHGLAGAIGRLLGTLFLR